MVFGFGPAGSQVARNTGRSFDSDEMSWKGDVRAIFRSAHGCCTVACVMENLVSLSLSAALQRQRIAAAERTSLRASDVRMFGMEKSPQEITLWT